MKKFFFCCTLLFSISLASFSQPQPYKNLVLEGGGVRGFTYIGAFEILDSLGILEPIEKIGGTSAGAIQAALLAIGYTPAELINVAANIPLKEFNDGFLPGGFSRVSNKLGFFKGDKLNKWIEQLIAAKTGDANITFMQLHQQRSAKHYKDLYITGTDLTYRSLRIFSYESYPDMQIKDAVRISFSIPLYFEPVLIDDDGKVQQDRNNRKLHLMVDGGLLSNYPVQMFDSVKYTPDSSENAFMENNETLGLLLDRPEQLTYNEGIYPLPIRSLGEYIRAVYQTLIDKPNPDVKWLKRTITISHMNMTGRVRKLSRSTIQKLEESGRQGVREFFKINPEKIPSAKLN
ncbi:MAG: patatin-like phospholipase family protein [Segetibacter sp.]